MFCTQKTLLWQGRPIRRPQGPLLAPGKGTVSCSGQRPAGLFHTGRAAAAGGAPLSGKKGAPCAPSVRTGKKRYCAAKSYGICSPFRAHGEEADGLSPCTAHREEAGACPCPHPGPGHRRGPLAPFRPATAEKEKPRSKAGCISLWGERWDLNPRPPGPQPGALPTELLPP